MSEKKKTTRIVSLPKGAVAGPTSNPVEATSIVNRDKTRRVSNESKAQMTSGVKQDDSKKIGVEVPEKKSRRTSTESNNHDKKQSDVEQSVAIPSRTSANSVRSKSKSSHSRRRTRRQTVVDKDHALEIHPMRMLLWGAFISAIYMFYFRQDGTSTTEIVTPVSTAKTIDNSDIIKKIADDPKKIEFPMAVKNEEQKEKPLSIVEIFKELDEYHPPSSTVKEIGPGVSELNNTVGVNLERISCPETNHTTPEITYVDISVSCPDNLSNTSTKIDFFGYDLFHQNRSVPYMVGILSCSNCKHYPEFLQLHENFLYGREDIDERGHNEHRDGYNILLTSASCKMLNCDEISKLDADVNAPPMLKKKIAKNRELCKIGFPYECNFGTSFQSFVHDYDLYHVDESDWGYEVKPQMIRCKKTGPDLNISCPPCELVYNVSPRGEWTEFIFQILQVLAAVGVVAYLFFRASRRFSSFRLPFGNALREVEAGSDSDSEPQPKQGLSSSSFLSKLKQEVSKKQEFTGKKLITADELKKLEAAGSLVGKEVNKIRVSKLDDSRETATVPTVAERKSKLDEK